MDFAVAILGFLTGFLGLILAGLSLWSRIIKGIKAAAVEVLVECGLVRHGEGPTNWPNGSRNLPDFLDALYQTQQRLIDQEEARRED